MVAETSFAQEIWGEAVDVRTRRTYYYNITTLAVEWTLPIDKMIKGITFFGPIGIYCQWPNFTCIRFLKVVALNKQAQTASGMSSTTFRQLLNPRLRGATSRADDWVVVLPLQGGSVEALNWQSSPSTDIIHGTARHDISQHGTACGMH